MDHRRGSPASSQILAWRRRSYGNEHEETLSAMGHLALALLQLDQDGEVSKVDRHPCNV